jgi:hypothetical protein
LPVDLSGIPAEGTRSYSTDNFKPRLTPAGRNHPVTALSLDPKANEARWSALPPLQGINKVARLQPAASALLVHPSQTATDGKPAPVVAVTEAGKGRTLALLTDSAWNWGFAAASGEERQRTTPEKTGSDDGRALQRFWDGAIRWLVRDPALTLLHVGLDRNEYRRGQTVAVRVRALHSDYTPAGRSEVTLDLLAAEEKDDASKPVRSLALTTGEDGEANSEIGGLSPGAFRLRARATVDGRPLEEQATFVLRPEGRELEDVVSRDQVLREIASGTRGEFSNGVLSRPSVRPARQVRVGSVRTVAVWANPFMLLIAVLLLSAEWTLRRRSGHS